MLMSFIYLATSWPHINGNREAARRPPIPCSNAVRHPGVNVSGGQLSRGNACPMRTGTSETSRPLGTMILTNFRGNRLVRFCPEIRLTPRQIRPIAKTRNSVPRNFWDRVVGVHEFDRSVSERCKLFLLGDYLRANPEHHRASLDS